MNQHPAGTVLNTTVTLLTMLLLADASNVLAEVHYVDVNSTNATPPYTNWATAATNIQDAVDAAVAGDEIVVTNGLYVRRPMQSGVARLDRPLTLRSVNGPQGTIIDGGGSSRCVYLMTNSASLSGFTLTGGGLFCESRSEVVSNCVLTGNHGSFTIGSGAYGGTLNNCVLSSNSINFGPSGYGGGAAASTLNNCILTGNSAGTGGGAYSCTLNNCTLTGNSASWLFGGAAGCTLHNCVSFGNYSGPLDGPPSCEDCDSPGSLNDNNWTGDPLFVDRISGNLRLQFDSPCINAGNNAYAVGSTDLAGNPRINRGTVDIGAHELQSITHYVDVNSTNATPPYTDWATAARNIQDAVDVAVAGDEVVVTNGTYATGERHSNRVEVDKPLNLRSVNGPQFTTIVGEGELEIFHPRCVYLANGCTLAGFTLTNGWSNFDAGGGVWAAASNSVVSNCVIWGNHAEVGGGGACGGTLINCTLIGNSAEPPVMTTGTTAYGGGAYGCLLINCILSGNTARAGGGGAYSCTLNNCSLSGNSAYNGGGGCQSMLDNCTLSGNWAYFGGGASSSMLNNCTVSGNSSEVFGGGASRGILHNCALTGNTARYGGGADSSALNNCTLTGNTASNCYGVNGCTGYGGGASLSTLTNCTVTGNSAYSGGGGVYSSTLNNCIACFNISTNGANYDLYGFSTVNYCCTTPLPTNGFGNITNAPLFVDTNGWANLRLQSNSPCINAGNNAYAPAGPDLDGNPRIVGGTVDMGAYEFQSPVSIISYAWLQQYGLPIDGSVDYADPDGDGVDNWHEWLAGTDPTNALSSPAQLTLLPSGTNVLVTWSTNAVGFTLESTANLTASAVWTTNSSAPVVTSGQNVVTNPITGAQKFYRLVQ